MFRAQDWEHHERTLIKIKREFRPSSLSDFPRGFDGGQSEPRIRGKRDLSTSSGLRLQAEASLAGESCRTRVVQNGSGFLVKQQALHPVEFLGQLEDLFSRNLADHFLCIGIGDPDDSPPGVPIDREPQIR